MNSVANLPECSHTLLPLQHSHSWGAKTTVSQLPAPQGPCPWVGLVTFPTQPGPHQNLRTFSAYSCLSFSNPESTRPPGHPWPAGAPAQRAKCSTHSGCHRSTASQSAKSSLLTTAATSRSVSYYIFFRALYCRGLQLNSRTESFCMHRSTSASIHSGSMPAPSSPQHLPQGVALKPRPAFPPPHLRGFWQLCSSSMPSLLAGDSRASSDATQQPHGSGEALPCLL